VGELAHVFGFPMLCRVDGLRMSDFDSFLPSQLFQSILESPGIKESPIENNTSSISHLHVQPQLPLHKFPRAMRLWISSVNLWLSHEWIDVNQVSSKAVKRDDAQTPTAMWDQ
jgi:hypothetical protein